MHLPATHELRPFLPAPAPVEFISEVIDTDVIPGGILLTCATERHDPSFADYYGTKVETVFVEPQPGRPASVRIDVCEQGTFRIRMGSGELAGDDASPMVVAGAAGGSQMDVEQDGAQVVVSTPAARLVVTRAPFGLQLTDPEGAPMWTTRPVDVAALARQEPEWNPTEQRWIFVHRYAYPPGWTVSGDAPRSFASFDLHHEEHIYGFGEGFGPLDKRGTSQRLWIQEAFSNTSPASYKQVPFYVSGRGYGLFTHTSNAVSFNVGDVDHTALSVVVNDTDMLDFYLFYGPEPKEILPRYTAVTGRPTVPPKWTFGLWMSRITYRTQEEVEEVAETLRAHRIPCDVIHIDTGWFANEYVCDWEFGPRFPDPEGMIRRLAEQGFKVSLWQWPNVTIDSSAFDEGRDRGYFARRPSGHVHLQPGGYGQDGAVIDFSNPGAVEWYQEKIERLLTMGVAAIKVDYGEGAPPDAVYSNMSSAAAHNLYPLLYQQAVWEVTEKVHGQGQAALWARSGWAGSQRYPIHWSGDGVARFADLACVVRSMLSFGLSGFPFYSHDIGGFVGVPTPELYVRWAQLGLFSSHARAHGVPPREPWAFGEQTEAVVRKYTELRYRLLPYIWTEANRCGQTSLPFIRPLVIDFPDDPVAATVEDAYLFGPDILVAPVLDERAHRRVYLPPGQWVDFWTAETVDGGHFVTVDAPLDHLPMWVRGGAIIPMGPVRQHVDEHPTGPLTINLYGPLSSGSYTIVEDDGTIDVTYECGNDLWINVTGATGPVEVIVHGRDVQGPGARSTDPAGHVRFSLP